MSYRITYCEMPVPQRNTVWTEEFPTEHQAMGRARELLETGEHHGVAVCDQRGNELHGICLQLRLGGFSGD